MHMPPNVRSVLQYAEAAKMLQEFIQSWYCLILQLLLLLDSSVFLALECHFQNNKYLAKSPKISVRSSIAVLKMTDPPQPPQRCYKLDQVEYCRRAIWFAAYYICGISYETAKVDANKLKKIAKTGGLNIFYQLWLKSAYSISWTGHQLTNKNIQEILEKLTAYGYTREMT